MSRLRRSRRGNPYARSRRCLGAEAGVSSQLRAYLLANVAFLVPSGLFTILFPWLVVVRCTNRPSASVSHR